MKITAWSFSRWSTYDQCPRFAKYRYIDKLDEPPAGPALLRGREVHDDAEWYLTAKPKPKRLPPALTYFEEDFNELRKQRAVAEGKWGFDEHWEPTDYFGPDIWCRMILDVFVRRPKRTARVIDFKTGREYSAKHRQQLELYAVGAWNMDDDLQIVIAEMWYLDSGESTEVTFSRKNHEAELTDLWAQRTEAMLVDETFDPTPSKDACKWCPHHKKKGGPCDVGA